MALEHHVRQMEGTKQYVAEIKNMSQELLEVTEKIATDFVLIKSMLVFLYVIVVISIISVIVYISTEGC